MASRSFPKAYALLFDHIAIVNLASGIAILRASGKRRYINYAANLEWLESEGIISEHALTASAFDHGVEIEARAAWEANRQLEAGLERARLAADSGDPRAGELFQSASNFIWDMNAYAARAAAIQLSRFSGRDAVPLLYPRQLEESVAQTARAHATLEVVLNSVPTPSDSVPWEDILAFKCDPETRERLVALRRWMRKVAQSDITVALLTEELESLRSSYVGHVRRLDAKHRLATVRSVVTAIPEALENLVKVKWKDLVSALFSATEARHTLLEEERKAPGREVSYLVTLDREFGEPHLTDV